MYVPPRRNLHEGRMIQGIYCIVPSRHHFHVTDHMLPQADVHRCCFMPLYRCICDHPSLIAQGHMVNWLGIRLGIDTILAGSHRIKIYIIGCPMG